ncbi:hypothetical protein, partial [Crocosphaera watsonii]|uniref:hypothetical protein n=1 Tax=Crocosphaera watsonii TaxID=263511 RepID=UPI0006518EE6
PKKMEREFFKITLILYFSSGNMFSLKFTLTIVFYPKSNHTITPNLRFVGYLGNDSFRELIKGVYMTQKVLYVAGGMSHND